MWIVGVLLAMAPLIYGIVCCITAKAKTINVSIQGFRSTAPGLFLEIRGSSAVSMGLFWTGVALFMHFHWFWGNHPRLVHYHEIGKCLSILVVIGAIVAYFYSMVW